MAPTGLNEPRRVAAARYIPALLALLLLGPYPVGAQASPPEDQRAGDNPVPVLGLLLPPDSPCRESVLQGVRTALGEAPGAARLVVRGPTASWGSDAAEAAGLVAEDRACALLGSSDGVQAHLLIQVARRAGVPAVVLCPWSSVTAASPRQVARVVPRLRDELRVLLEELVRTDPAGDLLRWGLVVPPEREGREARETREVLEAFRAAGRKARILAQAGGHPPDPGHLQAALGREPCDVVLLVLPPAGAGQVARALRAAGFEGQLAGPGALLGPAFLEAAGSAAEGLVSTVPGPASEDRPAAWTRRLQEGGQTAAMAHDAALLLLATLKGRSLPPVRPLQGATGMLRFDERGNRLGGLHLVRISRGRVVSWEPETCAEPGCPVDGSSDEGQMP